MFEPQTAGSTIHDDTVALTFNLDHGVMNAYSWTQDLVASSATVDSSNGLLTFLHSGPNVTPVPVYTELVRLRTSSCCL